MGADIRRGMHFDAGNDTHGDKRGDDRAASVADEGQGQTDNRQKSEANADVDQNLEQEHGRNADADQAVHIIRRFDADIDDTNNNCHQKQKNNHTSDQAELFADG